MKFEDFHRISENMGVVHFVGIGGVGMSGIAEVLLNLGCRVQGSDLSENAATTRLRSLGARVFIGHRAEHLHGCDVVVVSSAVSADNAEIRTAIQHRIPVLKRAEMLAELMRFRFGIAVAGAHGKTTTTSLIAAILSEAGLDPTFVVGGRVNSHGANARLGSGRYLVTEADESDVSFLHLQPMMCVVTNIDADHLGAYGGRFETLKQGFVDFVHNLPFYGPAVVCNEDEVVRELYPRLGRPLITYGFRPDSNVIASDLCFDEMSSRFNVSLPQRAEPLAIRLNLPGRYNVLNALAAIGVCHEIGVDDDVIQHALEHFQGIGRRFQSYGEIPVGPGARGRAMLVDDYGHHPGEIAAVLDAVSEAWPGRRKVLVFQPHRYTRTSDLFDEFCEVLADADELVLLGVYAAGEERIEGADSPTLCRAIRARGRVVPIYVKSLDEAPSILEVLLRDGDLLLTMGAGSVGGLAKMLVERFCSRRRPLERAW